MDEKVETTMAVLGGGPAGYVAAIRAVQLGAKVVLIEENELGGVCLNRGCIPTKAFLQNSKAIYFLQKCREFGIETPKPTLNWLSAWSRKERVVKNLRQGLEQLIAANKISLIQGKGKLQSPKEITVETKEGAVEVSFQKLVIAVGSEPALPNISGVHLDGILTSNEALQLQDIPKSMIILGAGVIGLEFANMFQEIGTKVTVIEQKNRSLADFNPECSDALQKVLKRRGIAFHLDARVREITKVDGGLQVAVDAKGKEEVFNAEKVLVATGRRIRTEASWAALGIDLDLNGAIRVNEKMETALEGIYAAGDVTGGKFLAHLASAQGKAAAENALGMDSKIQYNTVPSCIYTSPELASVGIDEKGAENRGLAFKVGRFDFRHNGRALTIGERDGFVKVVIDADSHLILGGQIVGEQASELISELVLAITLNAKAEILADMIHPHPTLSEAIMEACAYAVGRSIHKGG